ncbi:MAG: hypothetical protein DRJ42_21120 [Deltaproteobacteria bacterium]|nr:MAG: hypothetical protein DRJ42_21120 [Deltaproteobacteria bacterium]
MGRPERQQPRRLEGVFELAHQRQATQALTLGACFGQRVTPGLESRERACTHQANNPQICIAAATHANSLICSIAGSFCSIEAGV